MNRRVLLVDVDPEFQDTLTKQLGRYRVIVMTETDPERALALGQADPPDLAIISVEEPDKLGFKTFQKFRKVLPPKMPIMLITASVAGDAFVKHKSLKVHANDYLDKRSLTNEELIAKIDNLIGLGDLQEDEDISVPVDEDIPVEIADGDVVLDEQLDDDDPHGDFANDLATVGPNNGIGIDDLLGAETDAAFASLLGGDEVPAPPKKRPLPGVAPIEEKLEAAEPEPLPEPDAEPIPEPVPEPVPEPLEDAVEAVAPEDSGIPEPVPHKIPDDEPPPNEGVPRAEMHDFESVPSRIDDGGMRSNVYSPVDDSDDYVDVDSLPSPAPMATKELDGDEPTRAADPGAVSLAAIAIADDDLVSFDEEIPVETEEPDDQEEVTRTGAAELAPIIAAESRRTNSDTATPRAARQTGNPIVDLGLDAVAQRAESEQSGVHDRKAVRKIDELERQITQLKQELERARATADSAAKGGREAQFLNLREQSLAKDKELKQLRASNEQHAKDLAEAQEMLRQAQHAKQTLEAKNSQLEERLLDDSDKVKETASQLDAIKAKAAQLEADLDAKSRAVAAAETALAQAEKDLAKERANRAATASEAERTLRTEREQIVVRHKGELAAQRAESEAAQELAIARVREDMDAAHAAKLEQALEELRRTTAADHSDAIEALRSEHGKQLVELKSEQAGELSRTNAKIQELETALAEARAGAAAAIAAARDAQDEELDDLRLQHAEQLNGLKQEHATHVEQLTRDHDAAQHDAAKQREQLTQQLASQVTQLKQQHAQQIEQLTAQVNAAKLEATKQIEQLTAQANAAKHEAATQIEQLQQQHAAAIEALQDDHAESQQRDAESHGQAIAQLKQELDRTVAELTRRQEEERAQFADAAKLTAESHRAALAEQQQKLEAQLLETQETARREVSEVRAALHAAKKAADDTAARAAADREDLQQAHARAIGELEAKHERAMAVANGEALKAKAVADAERAKETNALKVEHERSLNELKSERDELQRGLSGARESLKRTETELASAVQTIADRNADLRTHQQAIAERDQRISELRGEIESLEQENANYQDQVLRAYQKIKADEAMVARARKAMAIALTVLDDQGVPTDKPPTS